MFKATNEPGKRNLSLHSDFLHAEMEGDFRLGTLIAHSRKLLHAYIPSFVKAPRLKKDTPDEVALYMHIDHTEPIEKIFGIPLQIPKAGHINGYFNSRTEELDFNASIPSFNYNGQQLDDIRILAGRVNVPSPVPSISKSKSAKPPWTSDCWPAPPMTMSTQD